MKAGLVVAGAPGAVVWTGLVTGETAGEDSTGAGAVGWLKGGTTTVVLSCSQPSVQVITEVTMIVLVEVTG